MMGQAQVQVGRSSTMQPLASSHAVLRAPFLRCSSVLLRTCLAVVAVGPHPPSGAFARRLQLLTAGCKTPRRGLRIPNTDPAPFVFCEFCKSMQTHGNAPQGPEKQVYQNSKVHRSGVRCAAGCCIKSVKSVFRARAPRARDARASLIHIKSDSRISIYYSTDDQFFARA